MTETTTTPDVDAPAAAVAAPKKRGGLNGKVLAELQTIAGELGVTGVEKMRKVQLIDAIKAAEAGGGTAAPAAEKPTTAPKSAPVAEKTAPVAEKTPPAAKPVTTRTRRAATRPEKAADVATPAKPDVTEQPEVANGSARNDQSATKVSRPGKADRPESTDLPAKVETPAKVENAGQAEKSDVSQRESSRENGRSGQRDNNRGGQRDNQRESNRDNQRESNRDGEREGNRGDDREAARENGNNARGSNRNRTNDRSNDRTNDRSTTSRDEDDEFGGRRRNRRNRNRGGSASRGFEAEPTFTEDDVLVPAAGILDILDNYAFVRTTGYLPSENDVYVSLSMVRKWGLRKGDAVVGQVRQPQEGERKEKFNPMVRIDSVNGMTLEEAKARVEFSKLTPLYPSERLRLEGEAGGLAGRVIDLVSPIGKGQRGLIVSPPKAGKTMIMQAVANAITENNPECHLMIVLVDERPEEVTDFQRTVKGEVIASTFDRPASDHTTVAELAIERAKRLVELGHDVVVLLDGITRLGRAYNLAAPASGRIMSGGVDSSALYPPKKFFGAARNIEDGGSLTILATALVETGSRMDEVIFEEFKGTGNWELRLRRDLADKRIFPAIDVDASSTRREELLMAKDELAVVWKLRRVLSGLEGQQGLELILEKLKKTSSNIEFLMQINKTMPGGTSNGEG